MLFTYAGLIVAAVLYEEEHKNGNMKMQWRLGFQRKSCFGEMHDCSFDGNSYNGAGIDCL